MQLNRDRSMVNKYFFIFQTNLALLCLVINIYPILPWIDMKCTVIFSKELRRKINLSSTDLSLEDD